MYNLLCYSQFTLFLAIVYFGVQNELVRVHYALGVGILTVSIACWLSAFVAKKLSVYHTITLSIVVIASVLGYLIRAGILPLGCGDYFGLLMQFGIVYSAFLLFDLNKVPNLLAQSKLVKMTMMVMSWQIISGVLLRGQNKVDLRLEEKSGFLFYGLHIFLAIFTFVALFALSFYLLQVADKWFKRWGVGLLIMVFLQVFLGVVALFASFRPNELEFLADYIRPLHFINSALMLFAIILLRKGKLTSLK